MTKINIENTNCQGEKVQAWRNDTEDNSILFCSKISFEKSQAFAFKFIFMNKTFITKTTLRDQFKI